MIRIGQCLNLFGLLLVNSISDDGGVVKTLSQYMNGNFMVARERAATFSYDDNGNLVQVVDMEGHAFQYTYDVTGNVTELNTSLGPWTFEHHETYTEGHMDFATTKIWDPTQNKPEEFELYGGSPILPKEGFHYYDTGGTILVSRRRCWRAAMPRRRTWRSPR